MADGATMLKNAVTDAEKIAAYTQLNAEYVQAEKDWYARKNIVCPKIALDPGNQLWKDQCLEATSKWTYYGQRIIDNKIDLNKILLTPEHIEAVKVKKRNNTIIVIVVIVVLLTGTYIFLKKKGYIKF